MFLKITDRSGALLKVEHPTYVAFTKWQQINDVLVTTEREEAESIVLDDEDLYFFNGYVRDDKDLNIAEEIDEKTYYGYLRETPDPEDEEPVIEEPHETELPLSREELTALVRKLQEDNRILTESILEMSEVVYGE